MALSAQIRYINTS